MIETLPPRPSTSTKTTGFAAGCSLEPSVANAASTVSSREQSPRTIQRVVRADQICVLTFDRPSSSANVFDLRTLAELE